MPYNYGYHYGQNTAHVVSNVGAVCGGLGAMVTIVMILRYRALQKTISTRLVFLQTCCYFLEALFALSFPPNVRVTCIIQAAAVSYFQLASMLWASVIIYVLFSVVRGLPGTKQRQRKKYEPNAQLLLFHMICWLIPLPYAVVPIITGDFKQVFGQEEGWCWVTRDTESGRVIRAVNYCTFWIVCIFLAVMSGIVWRAFRQVGLDKMTATLVGAEGEDSITSLPAPVEEGRDRGAPAQKQSLESSMFHRLVFFPVGQILLFIPATIFRCWEYFSSNPPNLLLTIGVFLLRSTALLNLAVYLYQLPVQKEVLKDLACVRVWFCGKSDASPGNNQSTSRDSTDNSLFRSSDGGSMVYSPSTDVLFADRPSKSAFFINHSVDLPSVDKGVSGTGLAFLQELRFSLSDLLLIPSYVNGELDVNYYSDEKY